MEGLDESRGAEIFFMRYTRWLFGNFSTADFHQIWPRYVNPCSIEDFRKEFSKSFRLLATCSQKPQNRRGQTCTLLGRAYSQWDALHRDVALCNPRVREFPSWVNFFVRPTISELHGVPSLPIFPYKMPKKYLFVRGLYSPVVKSPNVFGNSVL